MMPDPLLILGNPARVTNSELSAMHSANLPPKANLNGQPGIDALTGASNFDISEWMLLQLIAWRYLHRHASMLGRRRSLVYRRRPRFAIFGVGTYAFARWKVAISDMYKQLRFVVVGPHQDRPVVLDDTCYFIPCRAQDGAHFVAEMLNSEPAQQIYLSLIFWDDKRLITSSLLRRLSLLNRAQALQQDGFSPMPSNSSQALNA